MPLMPMPPIPMKWMGPISRGSLMRAFPVSPQNRRHVVLDAPFSRGMTRAFSPGLRARRSDFRDLRYQIGQPLGGIEPADAAGVGGHGREPCGLDGKARYLGGEPVGGELALH